MRRGIWLIPTLVAHVAIVMPLAVLAGLDDVVPAAIAAVIDAALVLLVGCLRVGPGYRLASALALAASLVARELSWRLVGQPFPRRKRR
jgi:hypothetical protein